MSQVTGTQSLSQIMADIDLGPAGGIQMMFAKLRMAQSQICKSQANTATIAKGAILQQIALGEEVVDLGRHLGARRRASEAHAIFMGRDICLPDLETGVVDLLEHRALQRSVVARDHRKRVQAEDIAPLQLA